MYWILPEGRRLNLFAATTHKLPLLKLTVNSSKRANGGVKLSEKWRDFANCKIDFKKSSLIHVGLLDSPMCPYVLQKTF
ncbi:MAG: hypothetical protein CL959_04895 [Euryarchaeota archaeon]|nr:hypothetical protein [Euryarchaeota archaeon]